MSMARRVKREKEGSRERHRAGMCCFVFQTLLESFRHVQDPGLLNTFEAFPYSLIPSCSNLRVLSACFNSVQVHRTGGGGNLHEVPCYFCRRCRDEGQGIHSQPKPASQLDINADRGRPFFSCQTELLVCRMSTGAHSASFNSLLRLAYDSLYYINYIYSFKSRVCD